MLLAGGVFERSFTRRWRLADRVDEIVLRRSAAVGQCIKFHTDVDHKTFQLCLNDDFDGGDLVFAADDKLVKPRRPAGSYTVHNDRVAHGVSTLERGARYALFFLMRAPEATK